MASQVIQDERSLYSDSQVREQCDARIIKANDYIPRRPCFTFLPCLPRLALQSTLNHDKPKQAAHCQTQAYESIVAKYCIQVCARRYPTPSVCPKPIVSPIHCAKVQHKAEPICTPNSPLTTTHTHFLALVDLLGSPSSVAALFFGFSSASLSFFAFAAAPTIF